MATAFDTFNQYAFGHYPGQIADMGMSDIVTRLAVGGEIGYGLGVVDVGERSASLPTGVQVCNGITVRETVRQNTASETAVYPEDHEMTVIRVGRVYVETAGGSTVGGAVYVIPTTGVITNVDGGGTNIQIPGAAFKSAVGAGEVALVQLDGNS